MKNIITSQQAYAKLSELQNYVLTQLREFCQQGKVIDIEELYFTDDADNILNGIDSENVYFSNFSEAYPLSELSLVDGIGILAEIESQCKYNTLEYVDLDTLFHYEREDNK